MVNSVCTQKTPVSVRAPLFEVKPQTTDCHKVSQYVDYFNWGNIEKCFYFNSCACNEFKGLTERHLLQQLPEYDLEREDSLTHVILDSMESILIDFAKPIRNRPVSHATLMELTRPNIKQRYQKAYENLLSRRRAWCEIPSGINAFVKIEKMPISKIEKPPRLIQYRDFKFTYMMKKYQVSMSKQLKLNHRPVFGQDSSTVFTKLYDNPGIAKVLKDSWDTFVRPVALCLDHSTWDAHVTPEMIDIEHTFWGATFESGYHSRQFIKLMRRQLSNRGRTKHGIKYSVIGSRMSGEFSTSDGNCALNYALLATWLIMHDVFRFRIHVNGDDSVIIIDQSELHKLLLPNEGGQITWFRYANMETKLDRIAFDFREIDFCQCSPIRVGNVWRMIRKPFRVISRSTICEGKWYKRLDDYIASTGLCELACNIGVPILQSWSLYLLSYMKKGPLKGVDYAPARYSGNAEITVMPVSSTSRLDFFQAFGITPAEQIAIESNLAGQTKLIDFDRILRKYSKFHLQH